MWLRRVFGTDFREVYRLIKARQYEEAQTCAMILASPCGAVAGLGVGSAMILRSNDDWFRNPAIVTGGLILSAGMGVGIAFTLVWTTPFFLMLTPIVVPICVYKNFTVPNESRG